MMKKLLVFLLVIAIGLISGTGCLVPFGSTSTPPTSVPPAVSLSSVDQAWSIIQEDYVDKSKIDNVKMSGAAITAMLNSLNDPYTAYMDAETYRLSLSSMQGQFEGIGAVVTAENKTAKIVSTQPNSPAEKAGLKANDTIIAVDGVSTAGMSLTEVIFRVRGPRGSTVRLTIQREGQPTPLQFDIVRAQIQVETVKSEMRDGIAVITINSFAENTDTELAPIISSLANQKASGVIIDLRENPGGLLQTVVDIASHFLKPGDLVVDVVDNKGNHSPSKAGQTSVTTDLPMVILVGNHSASGSEVLSGALKDYKRATIAGQKTFGKGSVNILRQLKDGSGIYITVARWLTPNGQLIEGKGIEPDIQLQVTGDDAIKWAIDYLKSGKKTADASFRPEFESVVPDFVYG